MSLKHATHSKVTACHIRTGFVYGLYKSNATAVLSGQKAYK